MAIGSGDVLRYALALILNDEVVGNLIFHYLASAGSGGDAESIRVGLGTSITTALNNMSAEVASVVDSVTATLWKWNNALHRWDGVAQGGETRFGGANVGELLPNQNAAQLDFFTTVPRRQGRKFIPGFCEDTQAGGDLTGTAIGHCVAAAAGLDNQVVSSGITLDPGVYNTEPTSVYYESFEIFTGSTSVETYMSTQRRRKPGVGI